MVDELVDVLDEKGLFTGKVAMKSVVHKEGLWHGVAHVWVYTSRGEMLMQQRASTKEFCPGRWDIAAAGHIGAGELPLTSALRELKEELGVVLAPDDLHFIGVRQEQMDLPEQNLFIRDVIHWYLCRYDGDIGALKLQQEEVDDIRLVSLDELERDVNSPVFATEYVPYYSYYTAVIAAIRKELQK